MDVPTRAQQKASHAADRRVRELYRYYRPHVEPLAAIPEWLSTDDERSPPPNPGFLGTPSVTTPPITDSSGGSNSGSSASRPATALGPEALVLGTSNNTLTAFAQLAALRLGVERAFICVLDRDRQFFLAEATRSVNLNDNTLHEAKDDIWMGATGSRRAWTVCQVSMI